MKTSGKILLYSLYAIAAAVVFLYLQFPSQTASDIIETRISKANPDIKVDMNEAKLVFPPGIRLEPLEVGYGDMPILRMDYLEIIPGIISLLGGEKKVKFDGKLGRGTLTGMAQLTEKDRRPQTIFTVNLANVSTEVFELLDQWPGYQVVGDVSGAIEYDSKKGAGGTTDITLEVTPTRIIITPPLVGIEQLEFSRVRTEMSITPRMLQIKHCELSGNQIEGKISGSIVFRNPIQKSRLTLSCTLKPQAAFLADPKMNMIAGFLNTDMAQKRGVVLRISGTVGKPSYVIR